MLQAAERETYQQAWALPQYAEFAPGEKYLPQFLDMSKAQRGQSVLDAGTGSGKGAIALKREGLSVVLCDITDAGLVPEARDFRFDEACLWHPVKQQLRYLHGGTVDWVYCCDVMEHIPTAYTMLVAARLLEVCRRGVFFSISLVPDVFGNWIGKPLHQTVQPYVWWRDNLSEVGGLVEGRDLLNTGLFLVRPRC